MDITNINFRGKSAMGKPKFDIRASWQPHSVVQILVWMCLALLAQALQGVTLLAFFGVVLALSLGIAAPRLLTLLRRTRWILVMLLLIYAYALPGDPWLTQLGVFSPSRAGVTDGLMQMVRLITVLAGLAIVLTLLTTTQLIAGLYTLAYPLRYLGISREQIAVRLALTLRYAESAMLDNAKEGFYSLDRLRMPVQTDPEYIELLLTPLAKRDWFMLLVTGVVMLGFLL